MKRKNFPIFTSQEDHCFMSKFRQRFKEIVNISERM